MPFGAYTIRNRRRNVDYTLELARGERKFYIKKKIRSAHLLKVNEERYFCLIQ